MGRRGEQMGARLRYRPLHVVSNETGHGEVTCPFEKTWHGDGDNVWLSDHRVGCSIDLLQHHDLKSGSCQDPSVHDIFSTLGTNEPACFINIPSFAEVIALSFVREDDLEL